MLEVTSPMSRKKRRDMGHPILLTLCRIGVDMVGYFGCLAQGQMSHRGRCGLWKSAGWQVWCGFLMLKSFEKILESYWRRWRRSRLRALPYGDGLRQSGIVFFFLFLYAALEGPLFHGISSGLAPPGLQCGHPFVLVSGRGGRRCKTRCPVSNQAQFQCSFLTEPTELSARTSSDKLIERMPIRAGGKLS